MTVFVASVIGDPTVNNLYSHIMSVCEELGHKAVRIDLTEPESTITEAILKTIAESKAVMADLTFGRPSVYFEAGFAHGLGIPLLLTCRKDHLRGIEDHLRVHFDLEQYKISFWQSVNSGDVLWEDQMDPKTRLRALLDLKTKTE